MGHPLQYRLLYVSQTLAAAARVGSTCQGVAKSRPKKKTKRKCLTMCDLRCIHIPAVGYKYGKGPLMRRVITPDTKSPFPRSVPGLGGLNMGRGGVLGPCGILEVCVCVSVCERAHLVLRICPRHAHRLNGGSAQSRTKGSGNARARRARL